MTLPPPFGDGFGQMMQRSWLPSDMMFDIQAKHLSLCFIAPGSFSWSESPSCAFYWEVVSTLPLYHKGLIGGVQIVVFLEGSSLSTRKAEAQRHLQLLSGTWSSFTPISQTGWSALARVVNIKNIFWRPLFFPQYVILGIKSYFFFFFKSYFFNLLVGRSFLQWHGHSISMQRKSVVLFSLGCGANFTANSGRVVSPNYPADYPSRANCNYTIDAGEKTVVILTFQTFQVEGKCYN